MRRKVLRRMLCLFSFLFIFYNLKWQKMFYVWRRRLNMCNFLNGAPGSRQQVCFEFARSFVHIFLWFPLNRSAPFRTSWTNFSVTVQSHVFFFLFVRIFISSIVANKVSFPSRLLFFTFCSLKRHPRGKNNQNISYDENLFPDIIFISVQGVSRWKFKDGIS
jgi:hypothetical protein